MGEKAETTRDEAAAARDSERRRAAAYLDLWERHVVALALRGPDGAASAPRRWPA